MFTTNFRKQLSKIYFKVVFDKTFWKSIKPDFSNNITRQKVLKF